MRIILTRHGETDYNKTERIQGQIDIPLNETGKKQAQAVALRLLKKRIQYIYVSDLIRARDTALEIHKHHPRAQLKVDTRLSERSFGTNEGAYVSKVGSKYINGIKVLNDADDAEPIAKMVERARSFINDLLKLHTVEETALVVAHGFFNRGFITAFLQKPTEYVHTVDRFHNTSITILQLTNSERSIKLFNCASHLE